MWSKIKTFFSYLGAVLIGAISGIIATMFFRSNSDRHGSTDIDDRDTRISEGITGVEEHLSTAESILQGAINRRKKAEGEVQESHDSN